jgi:2-keto-4-pentenoate hydratase/2-oxohepta-3-ene-1,7-dioic acid hydratase in catechol pathway
VLRTGDGRHLDLTGVVEDIDGGVLAGAGLAAIRRAHEAGDLPELDEAGQRVGAPVARPGAVVCIGLNYAAHAAESGVPAPAEPVVFYKAPNTVVGPYDEIRIPPGATRTDWEVELAVVIGRRASYVEKDNALQHVAGYVLHNDYSERSFQLERGGQWVKGKSADSFAPLGPFVATPDEIADVHALPMWLTVNGEARQNGSTRDLVFNVPTLVSYVSQFMTLLPGDVISTGTPAGVGLGMSPPTYLRAGDVVELGIDGLGSARQRVRAYS